jgi:hypothetical protein
MWHIAIERRDAVVLVQVDDDQEAGLWCVGGNIVDAQFGLVAGDEAVHRILDLQTGNFSVAFGRVDRPRTVMATTDALLLEVVHRKEQRPSMIPSEPIAPHLPREYRPLAMEHDSTTYRPHAATFRPAPETRGVHQLVAVAALVAAGIMTWHLLGPGPRGDKAASHSETNNSGAAGLGLRVAAPSDLFIDLEVDPDRTAIWLDGERAGMGRLRRRIAHDGRMHELRLEAPGYVTQSLSFREEAPSRLVHLDAIRAVADSTVSAPRVDPTPIAASFAAAEMSRRARAERSLAQRSAVAAEAPAPIAPINPAPVAAPPEPQAANDVANRHVDLPPSKPKIQIVGDGDAAKPKVRIIGERDAQRPKVRIVDGPEPSKVKVQIVDTDSPRVQVLE